MASLDFNAQDVPPSTGFDPLPAGDYVAVITDSEMKTTKAGTGQYLSLKWQVVDGQYKGRTLFANLNLQNPSDQAVGIARAELSAICHAVGVLNLKDSVELHNIPATLSVGLRKKTDGSGELENRIKSYHPKGGKASPNTAGNSAGNTGANQRAPWQQPVPPVGR